MKYLTWGLMVLVPFGLAGCPSGAVRMTDLEWQPPVLAKQECPNLTGAYQDRGVLHQVFYAGLEKSGADKSGEEPIAQLVIVKMTSPSGKPAAEMYAAERAFNERAVLYIRHGTSVLEAVLMDEKGDVYKKITVNLDTHRTGCYSGALILRKKIVYGKGEGSSGSVEFGEAEIHKLADGSLQIISRKRKQLRSILTGSPIGPMKIYPEITNRYLPTKLPPGGKGGATL